MAPPPATPPPHSPLAARYSRYLLRPDETRDLPGAAFLDVAELLVAEREQLIAGHVAELAGGQDDADEVAPRHRGGGRIVRIDPHQMQTELVDDRRVGS